MDAELQKVKLEAEVELAKLEATSPAKEVAGKAIGKFGLAAIVSIVVIGVMASLWLEEGKMAAVMGLLGASLTALIQMLNSIAGALSSYLFSTYFSVKVVGSNNLSTATLPESGWMPNLSFLTSHLDKSATQGRAIYGMFAVAIVLGVAFWWIVNRTRFGFELRASGINPMAASFGLFSSAGT